jgi:hypothetical protein
MFCPSQAGWEMFRAGMTTPWEETAITQETKSIFLNLKFSASDRGSGAFWTPDTEPGSVIRFFQISDLCCLWIWYPGKTSRIRNIAEINKKKFFAGKV